RRSEEASSSARASTAATSSGSEVSCVAGALVIGYLGTGGRRVAGRLSPTRAMLVGVHASRKGRRSLFDLFWFLWFLRLAVVEDERQRQQQPEVAEVDRLPEEPRHHDHGDEDPGQSAGARREPDGAPQAHEADQAGNPAFDQESDRVGV